MPQDVREAIDAGMRHGWDATTDFARTAEVDTLILCVPTPLTAHREPDLRFITATNRNLAEMVKEGTLNALLENIDSAYTVNLPEGPDPLPRLMQTLGRLNRTERLVDGTMPFQIWLKNAVPFAAARPEALKVINRALDEVSKGFKPASGGASASPDPGPKVFYQPVGAHECDMGLLIKAAVREIMRRPQGLIGFAVRTSSPVYLRNLLKRLRSNLPMQLHERELQAVTSMDSSMRHVEMLARSWAEMLKTSDVLVQIQVFSAEVAMNVWMRGFLACLIAPQQASMSPLTHRANPAISGSWAALISLSAPSTVTSSSRR